jgi:cytosine/adenosine deaminase-related metal-dependent hydrolase
MRTPLLAALSLLILSVAAPKARAEAKPPLAITNVTVVDVVAGRELPHRTVVIRGDRIAAVVPAAHAIPASALRIDGRGKWLIPGLWDMHMHALTDRRFSYFFPLLLANGVTGIREMGSNLPLDEIARIRRALDSGRMLGPRIGALSPRLLDGPGSNFPTAVVVSSPDEARATLRAFRKAGADFAKPYNLLSRPTYLAVVDEAKKLGMPVEGHVPFSMTALEVARLGQTTIEHDFDILLSASSDEHRLRAALQVDPTHWLLNEGRAAASYDPAKAHVLYLQLARLGVWSCPTVAFYRVPILIGDQPGVTSDPRLAYVPAWQVKRWSAQLAQSARNLGASEDRPRHYAMRSRIVREMHLAGVRILAGTDSGRCSPWPASPFMTSWPRWSTPG